MAIKIQEHLTYRQTAAFLRHVEAAKPENWTLARMPNAYFVQITVDAALDAGWLEATREEVENLTHIQARDLATKVWEVYNASIEIDPN